MSTSNPLTTNGPNLNGAKVQSVFSSGGEADNFVDVIEGFFKSFLGFMDRHPDLMVGLTFISDLIMGKGLAASAAGAGETKVLEAQGVDPSKAFVGGVTAGGVIAKYPVAGTAGVGILDFVIGELQGHKSILDLGKDVWHRLTDKRAAPQNNPGTAPGSP